MTNGPDYPPDVIESVVAGYSAARLADLMAVRPTLVALRNGVPVGTAALEGSHVRAVFVNPEHQGLGIGASLMAAIEGLARAAAVEVLRVSSSVTAVGFYRKLGFAALGEDSHAGGTLIAMRKLLHAEAGQPAAAAAVALRRPPREAALPA